MILAIVPDGRANKILSALTAAGYRVTRACSTGGFLHRGNVTLLVGVEGHWVGAVIDMIRAACRSNASAPSQTLGVAVFVFEAERFEQS